MNDQHGARSEAGSSMTTEQAYDLHSWVGDEYFDTGKVNSYRFEDEYESDNDDDAIENFAKKNFGFRDGIEDSVNTLNDLLDLHMPDLVYGWKISQISWTFDLGDFTVILTNSNGIAVYAESETMARAPLDALRQALRQTLSDALRATHENAYALAILLLRIVEEASWHRYKWLEKCGVYNEIEEQKVGWDAASVHGYSPLVNNPHGVNLTTVQDTAQHLLGKPIAQILKDIPGSLRVIHVEPVFRQDLVNKFLGRQQAIRADLEKCSIAELRHHISPSDFSKGRVVPTVEGMAEYISKPTVTFHGAPRAVVSSIVRNGFVVPGQTIRSSKQTLDVRCGSSYGVGIYSSPSLDYASLYGQGGNSRDLNPGDIPGFRMFVCATLMGRSLQVTRDQTRGTKGVYDESAHSHISPNSLEYIVFKSTQIIPCYVLHIDYGSEMAREHLDQVQKHPSRYFRSRRSKTGPEDDDDGIMWPAAKKAKAEALKAGAMKYFPYGFGPATGTRFVVEDVADVSDDEEDFGEYQAIRGEHGDEIETARKEIANSSWFDEYQIARRLR